MSDLGDITPADTEVIEDDAQLDLSVRIGDTAHNVFFRSDCPDIRLTPEARVTAALLGCMKTGTPCSVDDDLSRRFAGSLNEIQEILAAWRPRLTKVPVSCPGVRDKPAAPAGARVGTFFSGGVDSFYTLLKHRDEITDLIFVHGFDIRLGQTALRTDSAAAVERVGAALDKNVLQVETNLRSMTDEYVAWGIAHGAALATVGHLFSGAMSRIFVPATHTYRDLLPWGSHPLLDRLWGTESLEFVHDGAEATRVAKARFIAEHEVALESLRVCWRNPGGLYNCGQCEKCLRTMVNLRVAGALDKCTTFPVPLDLERVRRIDAAEDNVRAFVRENLEAVERDNMDPELAGALREALSGPGLTTRLLRGIRRSAGLPRRVAAACARRILGNRH